MNDRIAHGIALLAAWALASASVAAPPFSEDFSSGNAAWRFSTATPLTAATSGGPDGGAYVTHTFTLPSANSSLIFRAQTPFNSSNLDYAGNWIADGVHRVSALVRHNAPEPLVYNARFANENNFPGASYYSPAVPGGAWTQLEFDVTPSSPQLADPSYEGTMSYAAIFSAIGNMQFGVNIPTDLRGAGPFTFDLDKVVVSVVPEPSSIAVACMAAAGLALVGRRRASV